MNPTTTTAADPYLASLVRMTASADAELIARATERAAHAAKVAEVVARREAESRPSPAAK